MGIDHRMAPSRTRLNRTMLPFHRRELSPSLFAKIGVSGEEFVDCTSPVDTQLVMSLKGPREWFL